MFKFSNFAALAFLVAIAANTVNAADKVAAQENIAATVNGVIIPQARIDLRVKAAVQQGQPDSAEMRKAIRDDLINMEVIAQAAIKNRLHENAEVAQQIEITKQSALVGAFVQDYAKTHPVSEELLKQEYENLKKRVGNKEYKVAHILVATEAEANAIIASLNKKAKFDKIAKEKSKDPGSKENGGDLGWTVPANLVPPFAEAMATLSKGQISKPVQTQYGWHIIKLDDTRELKVPAYEEVRPNLEKRMQQQAIQDMVKSMRANATIQ